VSIESLQRKTGVVSCETIVNLLSFYREVCSVWFENHPIILGGPGVEIEIDEAVLVKRKNNQGRAVREQWVFGIYDLRLRQGYCVAVEDRTRETLFPIIFERVLPGSIITTDEARVYSTLNLHGFVHKTVKHKIGQFVNYVNNATTNHVESYWQRIKLDHKKGVVLIAQRWIVTLMNLCGVKDLKRFFICFWLLLRKFI
jgi:transposase-like protein